MNDPVGLIVQLVRSSADPYDAVSRNRHAMLSDLAGFGHLSLIAAGKASLGMALGAADLLGDRVLRGVVVVPARGRPTADGRTLPPPLRVFEGEHPTPGAGSLRAGQAVEAVAFAASADARTGPHAVVLLMSGGASALVAAPRHGLTIDDLAQTAAALMRSGADIRQLNAVRRRLDRLKGGGLARLSSPAPVFTYAISDVPGDDPRDIGSGPGIADSTGDADAANVLRSRGLEGEPSVRRAWAVLDAKDHELEPEQARAASMAVPAGGARILLRNADVVNAVARGLGSLGPVLGVRSGVEGDASALGREFARAMLA